MGTWGYRTFENDAAMDWLGDLTDSEGIAFLERSLLPKDDVEGAAMDADEAVEIAAASEIVYGLLNGPREGLPEESLDWLRDNEHVEAAVLKPVCERQLGRVLGDESDLRQLWEENKAEYPKWKANVEALRNGLKD